MDSILQTEKGLPPGLWLPLSEEPTDQYRVDVFDHSDHDYSRVLDFGAFAVALAAYTQEETGRISLMPSNEDLTELYGEGKGYGLARHRLHRKYGGLTNLQKELGFWPREITPGREDASEIIDRFRWIAAHAINLDPPTEYDARYADGIVKWASARNLGPSLKKTYDVFGGTLRPLAELFDVVHIEIGTNKRTMFNLLRVGAEVLKIYDKPLPLDQLDILYGDQFVGKMDSVIRKYFGTTSRFWMNFDRLPEHSYGLTEQDVANFGVRWAIDHKTPEIRRNEIEALSTQGRMPSRHLIDIHFGNIGRFRDRVRRDYDMYQATDQQLRKNGVASEVTEVIGRHFEATEDFINNLSSNTQNLASLSGTDPNARYVRSILARGIDLSDESTAEMQLYDLRVFLRRLGIKEKAKQEFVYGLIPVVGTYLKS